MEIQDLKKLNAEIEPWVCTQCGFCRTVCPVFEHVPWESASPRGKMFYVKHLLQKGVSNIDEVFVERMFQCTLCGHCQEVCQTNIDTTRVWQAIRSELGNRGLWPQSVKAIADSTMEHYNLFSLANSKRTIWASMMDDEVLSRVNKTAKVAYFVGCVASFTGRIGSIPESTIAILNAADVDYTLLGPDEWCCGNPLFYVGAHSAAIEIAQHNIQKLHELGVEKVVVNCAGCYRAFKNEYPKILNKELDIEILHFSQFLCQLKEEGKLKFTQSQEMTITYHDPCEIGRHCGIYDEPRYVLNSLPGVKLIEMPNNRNRGECCGGAGLLKATDPELSLDIAQRRIDQAKLIQATDIVTACVTCKLHMADAARDRELDMRIHDISEFVAQFL